MKSFFEDFEDGDTLIHHIAVFEATVYVKTRRGSPTTGCKSGHGKFSRLGVKGNLLGISLRLSVTERV